MMTWKSEHARSENAAFAAAAPGGRRRGNYHRHRGVPVAAWFPCRTRSRRGSWGFFAAADRPEDFDAPLPEDLLDLFEGRKKSAQRIAKKKA